MSKKTSKINKSKKIVKKIKKSKHKGLLVLLLIIILGVVCFLGYEYFIEKTNYDAFSSSLEEVKLIDVSETDANLDITKKYKDYDITWHSSDENTLSKDGIVNRPSYQDGSKYVTLTASFTYQKKTFIYDFLKSFVGESVKSYSYKILVKALDPSNEDYIDMVINGIYMPEEIYDNIGLLDKAIRNDITISWQSSNPSVISNSGIVHKNEIDTLVKLKVRASLGDIQKEKEFDVIVKGSDNEKYSFNESFDELDTASRYSNFKNGSISYYNSLITEDETVTTLIDESETNTSFNMLKMRSNSENVSYFESDLANVSLFKFDYIYNQAKSANTYLNVYFNGILTEQINLEKSEDKKTYSHDFLGESGIIKVEFINNIASNKTILIDNIKAMRDLNEGDLDNMFTMPSKISHSIVLPYTTSEGGVISWQSLNQDIISNSGIICDSVKENTKVTLSATLLYKGLSKTFTFEIDLILSKETKDALYIYFIDICEEDIGDCGEAILIVYNDFDCLVDAGDQKTSTYNCVKNAINEYSNDQILDYVIATHPDSDHIGNMANVFRDFEVKNLVKFSGENFTTQKFKNLKAAYDSEEGCNVYDIYLDIINDDNMDNNFINISNEIRIEFIDTKHYLDSETNGRSIVFLLTVYDTKILFTGDADNLSPHSNLEKSYMNEVGDIDILKVVHHGTANGTSEEYLNVLKPEVAIVCNGNYLGNKHGHPHVETIDRLAKSPYIEHVYAITGGGLHCEMTSSGAFKGTTTLEESKIERNGTITLTIDGSGYSFKAKITLDDLIDLRDTTYYKSYLQTK